MYEDGSPIEVGEVGLAVVSIAKASEPEAGSERQKEPTDSVARAGRKVSIRRGDPHLRKAVLTSVF